MPHRRGATGHRQPSRSSSATRLGPNLQFTQSQHKGETSSRGAQQPARLSSAHRIASREHVSAYAGKQQRSQPPSRKSSQPTTNKSKAGFTLSQSSHSDEESSNSSSEVDDSRIYDENEAEDDDEWESSESGAQTPNSNEGSEASEREQRDREMDRRRDEALKRLLTSGEVLPPPAGAGASRQAQQQGSGPVTAKPPPVVDDATAATPQPRNHLSQPPKHQHQHQSEVQPRGAKVSRVDTARPEELKSRASSAAARDRNPAPAAGNQMAPPPVPAAALAKAQTTNGSASTQAPSAAAQTQQHPGRSNGAPGSKLTIQTTAPTPPSNARSPAHTSQPPSQTNSQTNSPRPRESSRRQPSSRPSSGYNSRHSSGDVSQHSHGHGHQHQQPLRPHPLIRGHSFGLGPSGSGRSTPVSGGLAGALDSAPLTPKHAPLPSQLQPLTVIQDSAGMLSGSPEDDRSGFGRHTHYISSSPTGSVKTVLTSPGSPDRPRGLGGPGGRRTSVSSVHSSMTMPIQSSTWSLSGGGSGSGQDRKRTTSTLSHSSSTAALSQLVSSGLSSSTTLNPNSAYPTALSSLSHLPSVTRPPSPQAISFFPPMNTQVKNEIEGIHPLLPPPYIGNHLAVLARRNPVWESWERVGRARREMRSY